MLTVLSGIEVISNGSTARNGDGQFRNQLCDQIGKVVEQASVEPAAITIVFQDQSS